MSKLKLRLVNGGFTLVDEDIYDEVQRFTWRWVRFKKREQSGVVRIGKPYVVTTFKCDGKTKNLSLHRLVNRTPEGMHTDHIDGDTLNNTRANLRTVTPSENQLYRTETRARTGFMGVHANGNRFIAKLRVDGHLHHLGSFDTPEDAYSVYLEAKQDALLTRLKGGTT